MRTWITIAAVCCLTACSKDSPMGSGPARVGAGSFVLARVNTQQIPTALAAGVVVAGYLQLDSSGFYERQQRDSVKQPTGGFARIDSYDHGTWESRGDSIFLTTTQSAFGYGPSVGEFTASGATVTTGEGRLDFARIAWCGTVQIYHDIACGHP